MHTFYVNGGLLWRKACSLSTSCFHLCVVFNYLGKCCITYRKYSCISRDLYQKLDLKNCQVISQSQGATYTRVFNWCGLSLSGWASRIYTCQMYSVFQQPPWRRCRDWANVRITTRPIVSQCQGWGQFLFFNSIPIPIPLRSIPIPIPIPLGWKIAIPIPIPIPFYQFQFQFQFLFINSFSIPF